MRIKLELVDMSMLVCAYPLRLIHGIQRCFPSFYVPLCVCVLTSTLCCHAPNSRDWAQRLLWWWEPSILRSFLWRQQAWKTITIILTSLRLPFHTAIPVQISFKYKPPIPSSCTRANIERPSPTMTKRQMQKRSIARVRLSFFGGINEVRRKHSPLNVE